MPLRISLIRASSYRGGTSAGDLHVEEIERLDIQDRDVLLIDDIFDTG
jgi:hypoxanthine phosphoribosyltransferase